MAEGVTRTKTRWLARMLSVTGGVVLLIIPWVAAGPILDVCQPAVPIVNAAGRPMGVREEPLPLEGLDFITILVVGLDGGVMEDDVAPGRARVYSDIPLEKVRGRADSIMVIGLDR